jgi:hypothetical protein
MAVARATAVAITPLAKTTGVELHYLYEPSKTSGLTVRRVTASQKCSPQMVAQSGPTRALHEPLAAQQAG